MSPLTLMASQLAVGGLAGFAVGYVIKRAFKLILALLGLLALAASYLGYKGSIHGGLTAFTEEKLEWLLSELAGLLEFIVSNVNFSIGFIGGLILGLKKG